jgi:hypothetical protein
MMHPKLRAHRSVAVQAKDKDALIFQLPCKVAHAQHGFSQALQVVNGFDSMASRNFVTKATLERLGAKLKPRAKWDRCAITLGDNTQVETLGIARLQIKLHHYVTTQWCEVLPGTSKRY